MTSWLKRLISWYQMLSLPFLLIVLNVRLVMLPIFTQIEYTRLGFPADPYGFTTEDRLTYGRLGVDYLLNGESIAFLADQRLPLERCYTPPRGASDCPMFNADELKHMEDVKWVTQTVFGVGMMMLLGWIITSVMLRRDVYQAQKNLIRGSMLMVMVIVTIVLSAILAWDRFFEMFHALFFEAGTWRFYYSDTLIRLYPEQFWFDAALLIGTLCVIQSLMILGLVWRWRGVQLKMR